MVLFPLEIDVGRGASVRPNRLEFMEIKYSSAIKILYRDLRLPHAATDIKETCRVPC
ncbi:hypothetical protein L861_17500 [Litchfieldella anticariensis FP35 = DSM 16096]|uniref:Uncharacterized protein n=1 Tax=Litchfieldella anticariensis (strain DSM 16096 / CECT 5854 / CIP 108499 / LMG 22089 / FP35) TaxID=1121939 RepID=S2KS63_LITA3|nr:hypothetical protein L861_17500 [Halomonas anticariensis FP35 = DSM 16096]